MFFIIDVAVLWKIRRDLERIATGNPQRIEIEPFRFSFAYDGDTFCYSLPHIISRLGQYTDFQGTATLLISLACRRCMGKDFYAVPKNNTSLRFHLIR